MSERWSGARELGSRRGQFGTACGTGAVHIAFSQPNTLIQESVRAFYTGHYRELVTVVPDVVGAFIQPMEGVGLGTELLPDVLNRNDVHRRRVDL